MNKAEKSPGGNAPRPCELTQNAVAAPPVPLNDLTSVVKIKC